MIRLSSATAPPDALGVPRRNPYDQRTPIDRARDAGSCSDDCSSADRQPLEDDGPRPNENTSFYRAVTRDGGIWVHTDEVLQMGVMPDDCVGVQMHHSSEPNVRADARLGAYDTAFTNVRPASYDGGWMNESGQVHSAVF